MTTTTETQALQELSQNPEFLIYGPELLELLALKQKEFKESHDTLTSDYCDLIQQPLEKVRQLVSEVNQGDFLVFKGLERFEPLNNAAITDGNYFLTPDAGQNENPAYLDRAHCYYGHAGSIIVMLKLALQEEVSTS